ncbi:hypothetical protein RhiirC2_778039 [Rhizophagus irregularis]|uniref:Sel1 repeat family protein n=1 Tax=Rhizophagus irregularis TaxID=588596 RepID=A0A2N1NCW6_9GLOM|nr:hypothetical protein RhiirC2_778039 [Rhizophagus irregularis]
MQKQSNINDPVDLKKYINWLEKSIDDEYLDYYKYSEFKNIQQLGLELTLKEFVNELKLHRKVHFNENIIKVYGITKTETVLKINNWHQCKAENEDKIAQYNLAEQEYYYAQNKLAYFYENGIGTEKNLEKAIYWYQKALKIRINLNHVMLYCWLR